MLGKPPEVLTVGVACRIVLTITIYPALRFESLSTGETSEVMKLAEERDTR